MTIEQLLRKINYHALAEQTMQKLVNQFGWQPTWIIVEECAQIVASVQAKVDLLEKAIERAVLNRYCELWYVTCRNGTPDQQHEAFHALHQYFYRIALYQTQIRYLCSRDYAELVAEDVAQATLASLWQKLGDVKDPSSFLGYAKQMIIHELVRTLERESNAITLEQAEGIEAYADPTTMLDVLQEEEAEPVNRVEEAIRRCLRSKEQQQIVIENLLHNKTLQQIADALGKKSASVRMLKKLALAKLNECEDMRELIKNSHHSKNMYRAARE